MIYRPILKARLGEIMAIGKADKSSKFAPILEVQSPGDSARQAWKNIEDLADRLFEWWGVDGGAACDFGRVRSLEGFNKIDGMRRGHQLMRERGVACKATVGPSSDPELIRVAVEQAHLDKLSLVVRVSIRDLQGPPTTVAASIDQLLRRSGYPAALCDLALDFEAVSEATAGAYGALANFALPALLTLPWKSTTFISGAFPEKLDEVSPYKPTRFTRWDRVLWQQASRDNAEVAFGDYGVASPGGVATSFTPAPNIRYTDGSSWLVLKGRKAPQGGNHDYYKISAQLVDSQEPVFTTEKFSWGDENIGRCALSKGGPGAAKEWRAWSTSHHIAAVLAEL